MKYLSCQKVLFTVFIGFILSCTTNNKEKKEIYKGSLSELLDGELTIIKDYETKYINNLRTVPDNENKLFFTSSLPEFKGMVIKFFDLESMEKVHQIKIPVEGPDALKGGGGGNYLVNNIDEVYLIGRNGRIGKYNKEGKKILELEVDLNLPSKKSDFISMETRKGLIYMVDDWIQIGQNPSNSMKFFDPKERLMKSEFPLDFKTWLSQINLKTGEVRNSDFSIPGDYEKFQNDVTATYLLGAYDAKRQDYYLAWPYSDTIYHIKNMKLEKKFMPLSSVAYNYIPSEVIPLGEIYTVWALPKEASAHVFLLYDQSKDLFVRLSKTHESGDSETKFERTKHYVLSIYSGLWDPLGYYLFDFDGKLDVENWFLTSKGLFINKPEQSNEDEYEFYKIDLSKVKRVN